MNEENRELMKRELEKIASLESLSKNTYEIIGKILK
jgi:hypothetical protein